MTSTLPRISSRCRLPKNITAQEWLQLGEDTARDAARLGGLTIRKGQLVILWAAKRAHRALPVALLDDAKTAERIKALLNDKDWSVLQGYLSDYKDGRFADHLAEAQRLYAASNMDVGF